MHSYLSRYSAARGSSTGLSILGLTKVKACKSFLFTEGHPEDENKCKAKVVKWEQKMV